MSINAVTISGNLTRDAEKRVTQSGTIVVMLGMAVNDRRKNPQTGEWEDYPNFVDVVRFCSSEKQANYIGHLAKGTKVCVQGKLRWSQWERDGQKRSKIEVVADEVEVMQRNEGGAQGRQGAAPSAAPAYSAPPSAARSAAPAAPAPAPDLYDDEIPFD